MGSTDRRQNHRASLKREILDAASRLFVEEGFERVTMRRIAARIEYSPTTIYLYFKDKNELLSAVCEETFSQLAVTLERLQKTSGSPLGNLREGLRTYVDFGLANPNQYIVTFLRPLTPGKARVNCRGFCRRPGFRVPPPGSQGLCRERRHPHGQRRGDGPGIVGRRARASRRCSSPGSALVGRRQALVDHTIDTLIAGLRTPAPAAPRTAVPTQVQDSGTSWTDARPGDDSTGCLSGRR